ncbi:MAG: DUF4260 domain-containing protein [Pseudomonadota bacterium]|nr:DUF4260 domain-containing protein [Pseudomonadota bacterium]
MTHRTALETPQIALLRLEGLAALGLSLALFASTGASWWLFAALILAPDLSAVGYLAGPRTGAWAYNLAHTYTLPAVLIGAGWALGAPVVVAVGAVWASDIGMDRAVGYGLKHRAAFKVTHLSF